MDALSEILEVIRHKSIVYDKIDFCAPWGIDLPDDQNSQFWRLIKGCCYVKVPGEVMIEMKEGDTVLVPNGSSHWIADSPVSHRVPSSEFLKARDNGHPMFTGRGINQTVMIGGHFVFDDEPGHPFLKDLPRVIYINNLNSAVNKWLKLTCDLIFNELNEEKPGSKTIISRLADAVFIHMIRAYLAQATSATGFLSALQNSKISYALKLMQEGPEKSWKIAQLSQSAGMSRSSFCIAFKSMVGQTPLDYLTNWRMIKAKEMLVKSNDKISDIAANVGYQSEAAFSRIFKSKVSQTPSVFRQQNASAR